MTTLLAVRRKGEVCLFADGAGIGGEEGTYIINTIETKIRTFGPRAVLACRGKAYVSEQFKRIGQSEGIGGSLDAFVAKFDLACSMLNNCGREQEATRQAMSSRQWRDAQIVVAGWSDERDRPETYFGTLAGGELTQAAPVFMPNADGFSHVERSGAEQFTDADALRIFNGLRDRGAAVGGFLEKVTVTRAGIERHVLHTWADEIGQPFVLATPKRASQCSIAA